MSVGVDRINERQISKGELHVNLHTTPVQIEEERRICYVAISSAQDNCILLYNKKRFIYGREKSQKYQDSLMK